MESERWVPVDGWEGEYDVSDAGRVRRSAPTCRYPAERHVLVPVLNNRGYPRVVLMRHSKGKAMSVHRLVASAFIGPPPPGRDQCDHLDGDKTNNRVENLEWVSAKVNMRRATHLGRPKLTADDVRSIRSSVDGASQTSLAQRFGVSAAAISNVQRGRTWRSVT